MGALRVPLWVPGTNILVLRSIEKIGARHHYSLFTCNCEKLVPGTIPLGNNLFGWR